MQQGSSTRPLTPSERRYRTVPHVRGVGQPGYIFFKKGDLEQVVFANQKAVEVEPRYGRGYAQSGFAYLQLGRSEEAIEALEKALELNPDIVQALEQPGQRLSPERGFRQSG